MDPLRFREEDEEECEARTLPCRVALSLMAGQRSVSKSVSLMKGKGPTGVASIQEESEDDPCNDAEGVRKSSSLSSLSSPLDEVADRSTDWLLMAALVVEQDSPSRQLSSVEDSSHSLDDCFEPGTAFTFSDNDDSESSWDSELQVSVWTLFVS